MNNQDPSEPMLQTDAVIKRYLRQIEELSNQIREKSSQFKDSFSNDALYHQVEEEAKKTSQKLKQAKEKITQLPSNQKTMQEVKELRQDLKDAKEILSTYLKKYVTETGLTTIENDDGVVLKIVPVYKLEKQ
jgi:flagellar motor protein MotB